MLCDPIDYAEQVRADAEEEIAFYEEKDRELEEERERDVTVEENARRIDESHEKWLHRQEDQEGEV